MTRTPERSLSLSQKMKRVAGVTLVGGASMLLSVACTGESKYGCVVEKVEETIGIGGLIGVGDTVHVYGRGVQGPGPGDNGEFIGPDGGQGQVTEIVSRTVKGQVQMWMKVEFDCEKCDCDKSLLFGDSNVSWNSPGTVELVAEE